MKVIFLSKHDWANMGFELSKSLNTVGIDSTAYTIHHHGFSYDEQAVLMPTENELTVVANSVDVIIFMHSEYIEIQDLDLSKKKTFVFHGGSLYRDYTDKINKIFNPMVFGAIIQTGDLLNLGAKNESWLLPPTAVDKLAVNYNREYNNKLVIGHYPSCMIKDKGSDRINSVMAKLNCRNGFEYRYTSKTVPWIENLRRISLCDVYIERLSPNSARCSEWGVTALEAAALGCIVVTNFESHVLYEKTYGKCPINIITSEKDLEDVVYGLLNLSGGELLCEKKKFREWVENFHTHEKIGYRLLNIIK